MSLSPPCVFAGHPYPNQVLPRWLHQGPGKLTVAVSWSFRHHVCSCWMSLCHVWPHCRADLSSANRFPWTGSGLVISPLCLFKETRVRQGWNRALGRTKHQQAATTKVVDRRVALWGQSRHLFGQIAYQHGTGQDGWQQQCQGKGSSLAGTASSI